MRREYDTAQICLNGHVINSAVKSRPEHNEAFCSRCGSKTITECQSCRCPIRGSDLDDIYWSTHREYQRNYVSPAFCIQCGAPYPWTERGLEAARELAAELESLDDSEKELLAASLDDIVRDTPKTSAAATRFKRLMAKAGGTAAQAFKHILIDIASETAKKTIWG